MAALASFNHLMDFETQCVKLELRMKFLSKALQIMQDKKSSSKETYCALLVVQVLINEKNSYEYNRVMNPRDNFTFSVSFLLQERHCFVETLTELTCRILDDPCDLSDDLLSAVVNCCTSLCTFFE